MRLAACLLLLSLAACSGEPQSDDPGGASVEAAANPRPDAFAPCAPCHVVAEGGRSGSGPNLWGVYGRKAGALPGFFYSDAMKARDIVWDDAALDAFIAAPASTVPGTRMYYAGLRDAGQRREIIDWLKTQR